MFTGIIKTGSGTFFLVLVSVVDNFLQYFDAVGLGLETHAAAAYCVEKFGLVCLTLC